MSDKAEPLGPDGGNIEFELEPGKIPFDYIKGSDFRVLRADGVIGGLTPNGHIHFAIYSERQAIPRRIVHRHEPDGTLGEIIKEETVSRHSLVRELHADIFMTPDAATLLRNWLTQKLDEYTARTESDKG